jgi:hypothetical protein
MPSLLVPSVPIYRNPSLKAGLDALLVWLMERDYSSLARWAIYDHAAVQGTLAGCPSLDREDEEMAEVIFTEALPEVPAGSDAWAREDVYLDAELLAAGTHPHPLRPVCGGGDPAPEADEFRPTAEEAGPTPADLDWWGNVQAAREARRTASYLDGFNSERQDWTER